MHNETDTISIIKCSEEKDLVVIFDEHLLFDSHIQSIINKSNQMIGIIRRTFTYLKELGTSRTHSAVIRCLTVCQHIPVVRKNHKNQLTQQFDIICCLA